MQVIAYVPETQTAQRATRLIDKELPEKDFSVEYAINKDDLNQMVKNDTHDAVLVFVDDEQSKPYEALNQIDKKSLQGPIVTIYKDSDPEALLKILRNGATTALEFNKVSSIDGVVEVAIKNSYLSYQGSSQIKTHGNMSLDFQAKTFHIGEIPVSMTSTELKIMETFFLSPNVIFSRDFLMDKMYGTDESVDDRTVDSHIKRVRKKLNEAQAGAGDSIETLYGEGYKFIPDFQTTLTPYIKNFGSLSIDLAEQEVRIEDHIVDLTINEFMVLKTFALSFPENVSRDDLIKQVSKFGRDATSDTIDRVLHSLGRTLNAYGDGFDKFIVPVNGGDEFLMNVSKLDDKAAKKLDQDIETLGHIKLNKTLQTVSVKKQTFDVTENEMKILGVIMDAFPSRVTGKQLLHAVYGEDGKMFNLNNHFTKLRSKLKEANEGQDIILSRRGLGYTLDINSERVLAKFEDEIDILKYGPWTINQTQFEVSYTNPDSNKSQSITLNRSQFLTFSAIVGAYPKAISKDDLLKAVYGDDVEDKESALNSLYAQMKGVISSILGEYQGGFRKLQNGSEAFRFDLDIDDVPQDIMDNCDIAEVGPWGVNKTLDMFMFDGDPIDVNDSEYAILQSLIGSYPKPISTTDLAKKHFDGKQPSLNTCLTLLRKKVNETYGITEPFLSNKRGIGYVLVANRDELGEEQIDSMNIAQIGDVEVNMDLGQLSFEDKTVELNAAELFALKSLLNADKPLTSQILSDFSKAAGQDREAMSMAHAVRSLEDKMSEAGYEENLIDKRRHAGFFLSTRRDEIIANSDIQRVDCILINKTLMEVGVNDVSVALTPAEFKVVETLAQNPSIPLSIEDLSKLSDEDGEPFAESTLNIAKMKIKQKLIEAGIDEEDASIISNKARVGYYLTPMADELDQTRLNGKRDTALTDKAVVNVETLYVNTITDCVEYEGTPLETVKGKPLDLLVMMMNKHGETISDQEIFDHFFDKGDFEQKKVEMGVGLLKRQLDQSIPNLGQSLILRVEDKGYTLTVSIEDRRETTNKYKPQPQKMVSQNPQGGRRSMAEQLASFVVK